MIRFAIDHYKEILGWTFNLLILITTVGFLFNKFEIVMIFGIAANLCIIAMIVDIIVSAK